MDFDLSIPVKVISGENCIINNSGLFTSFGKKCIIVTGGNSAKISGALDDVISAFTKEQIEYIIFDKVEPNPLLSTCFNAGEAARRFNADFVLGIGGGSALDAAKAIAVFASNETFLPLDIYAKRARNIALPIVLVGTTAGTGSEVGKVAVLTNDETLRKKSISFDDCCPKLSFADSRYTHSMPYNVTVSTALDAFCHAVEGYFSSKCSDIPTMFAEKAIPMIWSGLKALNKAKELPNSKLRQQLYYGSLYAGITLFYCGTAFPHPLGYILTENYGVSHGFACAAFLPEFIRRAKQFETLKTEILLSLTGESVESLCSIIESLTCIGEISMTQKEALSFCKRWENETPNNFKFTPGGFTKKDAENVLSKFIKK